MFIKFDEFELLELFEKEAIAIGDEAAGMFIYSKKDDLGFNLVLTFSIYEMQCGLRLKYQNVDPSILDIDLTDVGTIIGENQKLKILRRDGKKIIEVLFKPHFALQKITL